MKKYYKILDEDMVMRGFKYKVGLNVDTRELKENIDSCSAGLHFSDKYNILGFLEYGELICEVKIPEGEKVIDYMSGNKSKAHSIILGEPRDLRKVETWEWIFEEGININARNNCALEWASEKGYLDIVKCLVEYGSDVNGDGCPLILSSNNGHIDVVKYLIEHGADVKVGDNFALMCAVDNGHIDVVKYLIEHGSDVNARGGCALGHSSKIGNLDMVKILVENGADIHEMDDRAIRYASEEGHLDVVKYLVEHGADIDTLKEYSTYLSEINVHDDVVNYLKSL